MANLNIGQIAGQERYEYRATVLVEKVFQLKGKKNNFMTYNYNIFNVII